MPNVDVAKYILKPWAVDGEGPDRWGCWALVRAVYADNGIVLPRHLMDGTDHAAIAALVQQERPQWGRLTVPRPLAMVAMRDQDMPEVINHFGVCLDPWTFLHSARQRGVIVSRFTDPVWSVRIEGVYAWQG